MNINIKELQGKVMYFIENYDMGFHFLQNTGETQYVDEEYSGKVCRFCGKHYPEVTFKKKAHAIPELLGNKEFVSRTECDACNIHFGQFLEDNLSKYLGCGRTVSQMVSKTGVPSYKSQDGKSRIDFSDKGLIIQEVAGSKFSEMKDNHIILHTVRQSYTPVAVYKAFVKMALSMLPYKEMANFVDTADWIQEKSNIVSKYDMSNYEWIIERFVPGPNPLPLEVWGFIRKNATGLVPYYQFVISFGNWIEQIAVPCHLKDNFKGGTELTLVSMPHQYDFFGSPYGIISEKFKKMNCKNRVKGEPLDIALHYNKYEMHEGKGKKIDDLFKEEEINIKARLNKK